MSVRLFNISLFSCCKAIQDQRIDNDLSPSTSSNKPPSVPPIYKTLMNKSTALKYAFVIMQYVQKTILVYSNFPNRTLVNILSDRPLYDMFLNIFDRMIRDNRKVVESRIFTDILVAQTPGRIEVLGDRLDRGVNPAPSLWPSHVVDVCREHPIGNCSEMATVGFQYAKTISCPYTIEMFSIINGDHWFLVIGRKEGSDPNDFQTWGDAAVVCDSWASDCYSATLISVRLRNYLKCIDDPLFGRVTQAEAFDSKRQMLAPVSVSERFPAISSIL